MLSRAGYGGGQHCWKHVIFCRFCMQTSWAVIFASYLLLTTQAKKDEAERNPVVYLSISPVPRKVVTILEDLGTCKWLTDVHWQWQVAQRLPCCLSKHYKNRNEDGLPAVLKLVLQPQQLVVLLYALWTIDCSERNLFKVLARALLITFNSVHLTHRHTSFCALRNTTCGRRLSKMQPE